MDRALEGSTGLCSVADLLNCLAFWLLWFSAQFSWDCGPDITALAVMVMASIVVCIKVQLIDLD